MGMFESLGTLHAIALDVTSQTIAQIPQMWWAILSFLQSDCEIEYWYSLDLLAVILQQFDFDDPSFMKLMCTDPPGKWAAPFTGIQPLVMKGITSEKAEENARALLAEFLTIENPSLIDSSSTRFTDSIIALLPFLLENVDSPNEDTQEETIRLAQNVFGVCEAKRWQDLTPIFAKYLQGEFNSAVMFLEELSGPLHRYLVKDHELSVFSLLRTFICFAPLTFQKRWMQIFAALLVHVDVSSSDMQHKSFAVFHTLMNLIAADDWEVLFSVFNTAVKVSRKVEDYQFNALPNPSSVARILDRFESARPPWISVDQNKAEIISTLEVLLQQLRAKCENLEQAAASPLVENLEPQVDPTVEYYSYLTSQTNDGVLDVSNPVLFAEDGRPVVISFEAEAIVSKVIEYAQLEERTVTYKVKPQPIVVPTPTELAPASPLVLRSKNTFLSPRPHSHIPRPHKKKRNISNK